MVVDSGRFNRCEPMLVSRTAYCAPSVALSVKQGGLGPARSEGTKMVSIGNHHKAELGSFPLGQQGVECVKVSSTFCCRVLAKLGYLETSWK